MQTLSNRLSRREGASEVGKGVGVENGRYGADKGTEQKTDEQVNQSCS